VFGADKFCKARPKECKPNKVEDYFSQRAVTEFRLKKMKNFCKGIVLPVDKRGPYKG